VSDVPATRSRSASALARLASRFTDVSDFPVLRDSLGCKPVVREPNLGTLAAAAPGRSVPRLWMDRLIGGIPLRDQLRLLRRRQIKFSSVWD
jgi:hypothetical protein